MPNAMRFGRGGISSSAMNRSTNLPSVTPSFLAWVRMLVVPVGQNAVLWRLRDIATGNRFNLAVNTAAQLVSTVSGTGTTGTATLAVNVWYHVAFVCATGSTKVYVNGVLDSTSAAALGTANWSMLSLCYNQDAGAQCFQGSMGALKIYERNLTAAEIIAEMPYALPVNAAGLNSCYPIASGWDQLPRGSRASVRGALTRWADITGKPGNEWTEAGAVDMDAGPPIRWAPSRRIAA